MIDLENITVESVQDAMQELRSELAKQIIGQSEVIVSCMSNHIF